MPDAILDSIRLDLLEARHDQLEAGRAYQGTGDAFSRLYSVVAGRFQLNMGGHAYRPGPGRLWLVPAGMPMAYRCLGPVRIDWVHFNAEVLGGLSLFSLAPPPAAIDYGPPRLTATDTARLVDLAARTEPAAQFEAQGLLRLLLAPFLGPADRFLRDRRHLEIARFGEVLAHIERHLARPLKVAQLARLAHLEKAYFSRQFKRHLGLAPKQYVIKRRLDAAQTLLLRTDQTLEQIAAQLGFVDAFHLSKTFKKWVGVAPASFRQARRQP